MWGSGCPRCGCSPCRCRLCSRCQCWPCRCHKVPLPAPPCHYVIPGSHWLDPPYSLWRLAHPRDPLPFESATRAIGTGLITGFPRCC